MIFTETRLAGAFIIELERREDNRGFFARAFEVCAVAKRDLKAGETLDDYGMFMTYVEAVNSEEKSERRYLPEGLVEGCRLSRDIARDAVLSYDDVDLPTGRLADTLRAEQYRHFRGESRLERLLPGPREASSTRCGLPA